MSLIIDNIELYLKTINSIPHSKLKPFVFEFFSVFLRKIEEFNRVVPETQKREVFSELETDVLNAQSRMKEFAADTTSERRANAIFLRCDEILKNYKNIHFPKSVLAEKKEPTSREQQLVTQQRMLNEDKDIKDHFQLALKKISKIIMPRGHIVIVASEPKQPYLNWVVPFLKNLKQHLQMSGVGYVNIIPQDAPIGGNTYAFMRLIESSEVVLLLGSEDLHTAATELGHVNLRKGLILPILISGDIETSFPKEYFTESKEYKYELPYFREENCFNMKNPGLYFKNLQLLIRTLAKVPASYEEFNAVWDEFLRTIPEEKRIIFTSSDSPAATTMLTAVENTWRIAEEKQRADDEAARKRAERALLGLSSPATESKEEKKEAPKKSATPTVTATPVVTTHSLLQVSCAASSSVPVVVNNRL